jgi:hypothetical protein
MTSLFAIGRCPVCSTLYREVVERVGEDVIRERDTRIIESNYRDLYLVLSDRSITRLSMCHRDAEGVTDSKVMNAYANIVQFQLATEKSKAIRDKLASRRILGWFWSDEDARRWIISHAETKVENISKLQIPKL